VSPELTIVAVLFAITFLFVLVLGWGIRRAIRLQRAIDARLAIIEAQDAAILVLKYWGHSYQVAPIGGKESAWQGCIVAVTSKDIVLYDRSALLEERLRVSAENLRWFGRPQKYTSGDNDIWLHVEKDGVWTLLKLRLPHGAMQDFVRALKTITTPELVTAYRRRRPYIHAGPETAQPASQDIHGAWTLDEPVELYLMPHFLVIQRAGNVLRKLALEGIQEIGALHRLDAPGSQGLVRFRAEEETFAFTMPGHEKFAGLLAEAAKRTLEAPLERKQKNKLEEDYDYDYDEDAEEFVLEENYDA
jgi:hypothetical protein